MFACLLLLAACRPGLPVSAREALHARMVEMAGSEQEYELVSIQKAAGAPEELDLSDLRSEPDFVHGCPQNRGGEETWCLVLEDPIRDEQGSEFSHFLLKRAGEEWWAYELGAGERGVFYEVGCGNWDAGERD